MKDFGPSVSQWLIQWLMSDQFLCIICMCRDLEISSYYIRLLSV